jgi:hypothetical protein
MISTCPFVSEWMIKEKGILDEITFPDFAVDNFQFDHLSYWLERSFQFGKVLCEQNLIIYILQ